MPSHNSHFCYVAYYCFSYYEFEQPIDERLTDSKWRRMLGVEVTPGKDYPDMFAERQDVPQPEWTTGYRAYYPW